MLIEYAKPQQMGVDQLMHVGDDGLDVPQESPVKTFAPIVASGVGGFLVARGNFVLGGLAVLLAYHLTKR